MRSKTLVYPTEDEKSGNLLTAKKLKFAPNLRHFYRYLIDNRFIQEIESFDRAYLKIFPSAVLAKMRAGDPAWESMVPPEVAGMIKTRGFFGYRRSAAA